MKKLTGHYWGADYNMQKSQTKAGILNRVLRLITGAITSTLTYAMDTVTDTQCLEDVRNSDILMKAEKFKRLTNLWHMHECMNPQSADWNRTVSFEKFTDLTSRTQTFHREQMKVFLSTAALLHGGRTSVQWQSRMSSLLRNCGLQGICCVTTYKISTTKVLAWKSLSPRKQQDNSSSGLRIWRESTEHQHLVYRCSPVKVKLSAHCRHNLLKLINVHAQSRTHTPQTHAHSLRTQVEKRHRGLTSAVMDSMTTRQLTDWLRRNEICPQSPRLFTNVKDNSQR